MRKLTIAYGLLLLITSPLLAQTSLPTQAQHQPVLLISLDGLRPDYVTQADAHQLKIPNLRRILAEGTHAEGVIGVYPTVTYPSHTTLITGVAPAEHGVLNNTRFDPERKFAGAWLWYAEQVKVPTLWAAAHAAGLHTASVSWPVTVNAAGIDDLIPEYWRGASPGDSSNPDDRLLMNAISRPDDELARMAARIGVEYMIGNDTTLASDEIRTLYSLDILKNHRPEFMTIHLSSLDEEEHLHGPFTAEVNEDLEGLDGMVGRLTTQELANYPNAVVVIVSDHGFTKVEHATNLYIPFIEAGLIQLGKSASGAVQVKSWKAQPWLAGGMAAVILHDANDTETRDQVKALLDKLAADPTSGVETVYDHNAITKLGGFPDAAFIVTLKDDYYTGSGIAGALVGPPMVKGMHGFDPQKLPAMRSSFFATGQGIAHGKDLGVVDMRQIAPTLAAILGVSLPDAKLAALPVR
jgi:predicted AlkP superfamily pyrophosphatase or phosphodiesterase